MIRYLLIAAFFFRSIASGFMPSGLVVPHSTGVPRPTFLSASTVCDAPSSGRRLHHDEPTLTLYEILGASPSDSHNQLRQHYVTLARRLHPDANRNRRDHDSAIDFSQVAAAWSVLADPRERLKYDRSLKAKEFTEGVEDVMEVCFQIAAPLVWGAITTMSKAATFVMENILDEQRKHQTNVWNL